MGSIEVKLRIPRQHRRSGFTLIELATVAVVMVVVASMAVPRFTSFLVHQRLEAAARRFMVDLALVQREARFTGTSRQIIFNPPGDRYRLMGMTSLDNPNNDYYTRFREEPYQVDLVSANFGGDLTVIFDGYGIPDSGGTIVLAAGGLQKSISVGGGTGEAEGMPVAKVAEKVE